MKKFLNTLWEFIGGKEDKDNFIQKALKVCKVFKVKPLKTPKLDVPSKKTAYNLFCKDVRKTKKELLGVPVSKASVIISKEWKKIKTSEKQMKNYKDLYEEENKDMKRHYKDIKKIMRMKWRLLTFTKSAARRRGKNLKKHQIIQARKNRSLKKPKKDHHKTASKSTKNP